MKTDYFKRNGQTVEKGNQFMYKGRMKCGTHTQQRGQQTKRTDDDLVVIGA